MILVMKIGTKFAYFHPPCAFVYVLSEVCLHRKIGTANRLMYFTTLKEFHNNKYANPNQSFMLSVWILNFSSLH